MEDIYKTWVDFGIDGFRIDTVKHVNMEFWQKFSPGHPGRTPRRGATTTSSCSARSSTATRRSCRTYTTTGKLPATLDFGFQGAALRFAPASRRPMLRDCFAGDDYYTDTDSNAYELPTFLGNHDMGRHRHVAHQAAAPSRTC